MAQKRRLPFTHWLRMAVAAIALMPTLLLASELPPLSYKQVTAQNLQLVDTRPSAFYQGWPMADEKEGGHVAGAVNISGDWKIDEERWPSLLKEKRLDPAKPLVLYGEDRHVAEVGLMLERQGFKQLFSLSDWKTAPRQRLARWQQLVYPTWVDDLNNGKAVVAAPKGKWRIFEVDWGEPDAFLLGHVPGAGYINSEEFESEPLWNKIPDVELEKKLLSWGITRDITVILYGRSTMAAARMAQILLYAGVEDVRLIDGGFEAWKNQYTRLLPSETGMPYQYPVAKEFGGKFPVRPELIIDTAEAKKVLADPKGVLVSVRSWPEFIGETSGYDYIEAKGDIAGSVWGHAGVDANDMSDYDNPDGTMKDAAQIAAQWQEWGISKDKRVVFYCGTGWRSSEAFFYAWLMGWPNIAVYDGGWNEWSRDPANPTVTGERKPKSPR